MKRRNFITILAGAVAIPASGMDISDQVDTILKLLDKYKFQTCKVNYLIEFAGFEMAESVRFKAGADYREILSELENQSSFSEWVGINLDDKLFITV